MWGEDYYVSEFTSASTGTALSISLMRVQEAWRVEAVWEKMFPLSQETRSAVEKYLA